MKIPVERRNRGQAGIEEIPKAREEILARRGGKPLPIDVAALIEQIRSERDEEILAAIPSADR